MRERTVPAGQLARFEEIAILFRASSTTWPVVATTGSSCLVELHGVYLELNMVRAGVVKHPSQWAWCSCVEWIGLRQSYRVIDQARICFVSPGIGVPSAGRSPVGRLATLQALDHVQEQEGTVAGRALR